MIPRKPHHKQLRRVGKGGRRTAKANKESHARFVKESIDCCQLCGSTEWLSNSHSKNSDRRDIPSRTALLCVSPCHQFLELKCSHAEREAVNEFLIDTDLEGEYRFNEAMKLLPDEKAEKLRLKILSK